MNRSNVAIEKHTNDTRQGEIRKNMLLIFSISLFASVMGLSTTLLIFAS